MVTTTGEIMGEKVATKVAEGNNSLSVMVESKILNCHICSNPLQMPVSQCEKLHFVCHECSIKNAKCTCSCHLVKCLLLDTILQSVTVPCSFSTFGCREKVLYSVKIAHEDSCAFDPYCFCPSEYCTFKCSPKELSSHFKLQHSDFCYNARYGLEFMCIGRNDLDYRVVIIGEDGRSFLLIDEYNADGTYVSLMCMGPKSFAEDLCYEISAELDADSENTVFSMKSSRMICIQKLTGTCWRSRALFLPSKVYAGMSEIPLRICISKK